MASARIIPSSEGSSGQPGTPTAREASISGLWNFPRLWKLIDLRDWVRWNTRLILELEQARISQYILSHVPEPEKDRGLTSRTTHVRWRFYRRQIAALLESRLSDDIKLEMGEGAGWNPSRRDPKQLYDALCKVALESRAREDEMRQQSAFSQPVSSAIPDRSVEDIDMVEAEVEAEDEGWTSIRVNNKPEAHITRTSSSIKRSTESMQDCIVRVTADLNVLKAFYNIESSSTRYTRLDKFYTDELTSLSQQPFDSYSQDEKVDYLLLKNYLKRAQRTLHLDQARDTEFELFVEPFAGPIKHWVEKRQRVEVLDPKAVAISFNATRKNVFQARDHVKENAGKYSKATGYRAARTVAGLRKHLQEMFDFYKGYDPLWDWWVSEPFKSLDAALAGTVDFLGEVLVGVKPGDEETIVGEPIGRDGLLTDLEAEMIPYSPEELLRIADAEYQWCEAEMKTASQQLGFGDEWRSALEYVKDLYEPPGSQPQFVKSLVQQGADYVKKHDLVTVPLLAAEAIHVSMIPPATQKVSPFFLGGTYLQVSYPTGAMRHEDKLMSLRGNSRHLSKATAFHEMIPGHHLQMYVGERSRPYRRLFDTPFFVEGWALYWEMVLWARGDFFEDPEDVIGTLFWRMHRCARIIFSLKFHLGQLTAQECVDLLVDMVGHERATAEGEVRRSFNGDYSPLYQAGYMLGALQLTKLRKEALGEGYGKMGERLFHDTVLKANVMPIEMLRALLLNKELSEDFESEWKFYGDI